MKNQCHEQFGTRGNINNVRLLQNNKRSSHVKRVWILKKKKNLERDTLKVKGDNRVTRDILMLLALFEE